MVAHLVLYPYSQYSGQFSYYVVDELESSLKSYIVYIVRMIRETSMENMTNSISNFDFKKLEKEITIYLLPELLQFYMH